MATSFALPTKAYGTSNFTSRQENGNRKQRCRYPSVLMNSGPIFAHFSISRRAILYFLPFSLSVVLKNSAKASIDKKSPSGETTEPSVRKGEPTTSGDDAQEDEKLISDIDPASNEPKITDHVFVDLSIAGQASHRLVIALYGDLMPQVVENFKKLATGGYADTPVYRIVPGLTVQLGDVLRNGGKIGQAAIDDCQSFVPDNFRVKHTIPGIVSMVRRPDGTVDSRFFIATRNGDSMYLDGRYAAFGRVVEGMEFLKQVEKAGGEGFIRRPVRVVSSGILE